MIESEDESTRTLPRKLQFAHAFSLVFASVGASAGVFSLWSFSYGTSGPAFFWAYPIVAAGVIFICLVWSELASQYPSAGSFYEWPRLLLGRHRLAEPAGWWIGWLYLFGITMTLTSILIAISNAAIALFEWTPSRSLVTIIALVAAALALGTNLLGIDRVGKVGLIGVVGELIAVAGIVTLTLILGAEQSPSVLLQTGGQTFEEWWPGFLGAAAFMPIWALYTFEGGGILGEETEEASKTAPTAILAAFIATVVVASYVIVAMILTTKDIQGSMAAPSPIVDNINRVLPDWTSKLFLLIVLEVLFLAANAVLSYGSRQLFGMARSGELPAAKFLARSHNGTPWSSVVVVAVVSCLPLVISSDIAVVVGGVTAEVYIAYILLLAVALFSRLNGWPHQLSHFSLGRFRTIVMGIALLVAIAIATNLLWPRDTTNPVWRGGIRAGYWMVMVPIVIGIFLRFATRRLAARHDARA